MVTEQIRKIRFLSISDSVAIPRVATGAFKAEMMARDASDLQLVFICVVFLLLSSKITSSYFIPTALRRCKSPDHFQLYGFSFQILLGELDAAVSFPYTPGSAVRAREHPMEFICWSLIIDLHIQLCALGRDDGGNLEGGAQVTFSSSMVALDIGGCFTVAFASGTPLSLFDAASEMCGVHRGLQTVMMSRDLHLQDMRLCSNNMMLSYLVRSSPRLESALELKKQATCNFVKHPARCSPCHLEVFGLIRTDQPQCPPGTASAAEGRVQPQPEKKEGRASRAKLGEVTQWRQTVLCCTLAGGSGGFSRQLILARGYQEGTKSVRAWPDSASREQCHLRTGVEAVSGSLALAVSPLLINPHVRVDTQRFIRIADLLLRALLQQGYCLMRYTGGNEMQSEVIEQYEGRGREEESDGIDQWAIDLSSGEGDGLTALEMGPSVAAGQTEAVGAHFRLCYLQQYCFQRTHL
ncbi:hypothetical protein Anapl_02451 [Anas platyrhynchos]|uniref:Uncharacterized protein n=1 Tax=Anas platyrhynchos TaxID=8839 RepID=R0LPI8_ANAPL|nr:hypothetical protein Anapl_02451 [Anas platyrhynchos]